MTPIRIRRRDEATRPAGLLPSGRRAAEAEMTRGVDQVGMKSPPGMIKGDASQPQPPPRPRVRLAWAAGTLLGLELACIRWFGATVPFLTFFTNLVLMACVLGMSVGLMAARGTRDWSRWSLPALVAAMLLAVWSQGEFQAQRWSVEVGSNASNPQHVYFGAEDQAKAGAGQSVPEIPIELAAAVVFALLALAFAGPGRVMGLAFAAIPNRLAAYTADLLGSLAGILLFTLLSALGTSPVVWFAVFGGAWLKLAQPSKPESSLRSLRGWIQPTLLAAVLGLAAYGSHAQKQPGALVAWSPYYRVELHPDTGLIKTNNIGHQTMENIQAAGQRYSLPYLLRRDAGAGGPGRVLIIGGGSGNDVAAALEMGAQAVDVVEIDRVLLGVGRDHHPNRPYDDPRVRVVVDDGRGFLKRSQERYDTIVFALVDSLALHSSYSNLRLESYLFTLESFREARQRLQPDGLLVMSNFFRQGWIISRLDGMIRQTFDGQDPLILSLPHQEEIPEGSQVGFFTIILAGGAAQAIAERFERDGSFWSTPNLPIQKQLNGFGPTPPKTDQVGPGGWTRVAPSRLVGRTTQRAATDDWPFLYLRDASIPWLNLRGMALVALLSLGVAALVAPQTLFGPAPTSSDPPPRSHPHQTNPARSRFNPGLDGRMFFLGAGFMLLETKGVVQLALVFGSTWLVNSIVFAAVLVMVLAANLLAMRLRGDSASAHADTSADLKRGPALGGWYVGLFAALGLNLIIPTSAFLSLADPWRTLAACAVVFGPILFAGVVFSLCFARSTQPETDFGSNVAGIVLGGLTENASLLIGFDGLIALAALFYALSAFLGARADQRRRRARLRAAAIHDPVLSSSRHQ